MSTALIKYFLKLSAIGITGLGSYGIYSVSQQDRTIGEVLNQDRSIILPNPDDAKDSDKWMQKVKELGSDSEFLDFEYKKAKDEVKVEKLKSICRQLLKFSYRDNQKLKKAKKLCVVEKTKAVG